MYYASCDFMIFIQTPVHIYFANVLNFILHKIIATWGRPNATIINPIFCKFETMGPFFKQGHRGSCIIQ